LARVEKYKFGSPHDLVEEKSYSREHLFNCCAHLTDRGCADGNMKIGCPSLIVSRMVDERECDYFCYLTYVVG
jgi:hypothetical protein